jgi:hypothetical protein
MTRTTDHSAPDIPYGNSLETVRAEIEKCDVLCANSHRQEHYTVPDAVTPPEAGGETSLGLE